MYWCLKSRSEVVLVATATKFLAVAGATSVHVLEVLGVGSYAVFI